MVVRIHSSGCFVRLGVTAAVVVLRALAVLHHSTACSSISPYHRSIPRYLVVSRSISQQCATPSSRFIPLTSHRIPRYNIDCYGISTTCGISGTTVHVLVYRSPPFSSFSWSCKPQQSNVHKLEQLQALTSVLRFPIDVLFTNTTAFTYKQSAGSACTPAVVLVGLLLDCYLYSYCRD